MNRDRHPDLFLSADDAELYAKQDAMARNIASLTGKHTKGQQVTLLVRSLVKRVLGTSRKLK